MTSFAPSGVLVAMLPCNDLDASERFYNASALCVPTAQGRRRESPTLIAC
jgi:hypothetical protein